MVGVVNGRLPAQAKAETGAIDPGMGDIVIGPIIYTTYGAAMGHRPEALAATGGLKPAGAGRPRERTAWQGLTRVGPWLVNTLVRKHRRHQDADSRIAAAPGMREVALSRAPCDACLRFR